MIRVAIDYGEDPIKGFNDQPDDLKDLIEMFTAEGNDHELLLGENIMQNLANLEEVILFKQDLQTFPFHLSQFFLRFYFQF